MAKKRFPKQIVVGWDVDQQMLLIVGTPDDVERCDLSDGDTAQIYTASGPALEYRTHPRLEKKMRTR